MTTSAKRSKIYSETQTLDDEPDLPDSGRDEEHVPEDDGDDSVVSDTKTESTAPNEPLTREWLVDALTDVVHDVLQESTKRLDMANTLEQIIQRLVKEEVVE